MTADRVDTATAKRLAPYRAGYTPQQRRDIERRLVEGELLGVAATDALELGIDIGLLDCAISVGFPGHGREPAPAVGPRRTARPRARGARRVRGRARPVLHARAGDAARAGASKRRSSTTRTRACSTATSPRPRSKRRSTTPTARRSATRRSSARRTFPSCSTRSTAGSGRARTIPPARTPLRSASADSFTVDRRDDRARVLGIVERERAYSTVHEGAVYLHLGEQWLVRELDLVATARGRRAASPATGTRR